MSDGVVIKVENISKLYRLGQIGTGTLSHDLNRWWHKVRGKEDPYLKIGQVNDRNIKGGSDYVWALKDINFEVRRGEVLGMIGRNGAGKSTLLKILSRVTSPTSGQIKVKGRIASLLEVGTGFHPELTGRENVYLNGAILGMRKREIDRKFDEIVSFAEVERYIDTPVKRYSSGMYVRLAFAVAAHLEPEILIVDEVLAVGDAQFQRRCLGKMRDVAGHGRTVLFVSHNMLAVQTLCSRCLLLESGTLRASGSVADVVDEYLAAHAPADFSHSPDGEWPRITSVRLLTPSPMTNLAIEILVEWFLPKPIPGVKVGVGFNTLEGQRIFDCGPEDMGLATPQQTGPHKGIFRVPPNALLARHYAVSVGIWRESVSFHHVLPALSVSVEPAPMGAYFHQSTRDGLVHLMCEWAQLE